MVRRMYLGFAAAVVTIWLIWWGDRIDIPIFAALFAISLIPTMLTAIIKKLQNRV
jgi:hypothetical protein